MPIYEYRCEDCGEEFEELQKMGADPPPCTGCNSESVRRKVSRTSFVLKGGGWYKDGYVSTSSAKNTSTSSSESTTGESSDTAGSTTTSGTSGTSSTSSTSSTKTSSDDD